MAKRSGEDLGAHLRPAPKRRRVQRPVPMRSDLVAATGLVLRGLDAAIPAPEHLLSHPEFLKQYEEVLRRYLGRVCRAVWVAARRQVRSRPTGPDLVFVFRKDGERAAVLSEYLSWSDIRSLHMSLFHFPEHLDAPDSLEGPVPDGRLDPADRHRLTEKLADWTPIYNSVASKRAPTPWDSWHPLTSLDLPPDPAAVAAQLIGDSVSVSRSTYAVAPPSPAIPSRSWFVPADRGRKLARQPPLLRPPDNRRPVLSPLGSAGSFSFTFGQWDAFLAWIDPSPTLFPPLDGEYSSFDDGPPAAVSDGLSGLRLADLDLIDLLGFVLWDAIRVLVRLIWVQYPAEPASGGPFLPVHLDTALAALGPSLGPATRALGPSSSSSPSATLFNALTGGRWR